MQTYTVSTSLKEGESVGIKYRWAEFSAEVQYYLGTRGKEKLIRCDKVK